MTTRVVATAGHVDHGKSTLVRALTGTDPDRLAEEKRRGLSIELGFAHLPAPGGIDVHLVDVPGHRRFIKTMVAGAGAVDACLLVVAAPEGWRPQTEEHLRILELLGVRQGLIAVTMADRAGPDRVELAAMEIDERIAGTFLEGAAVVPVDSVSGAGLSAVRTALTELAGSIPAPPDTGRARLWVDRSFPIDGAGTVVTGTLALGSLGVDEPVEVVTRRGLRHARVRGLQSFGTESSRLEPGCRAALNLAGADHRAIERGDAVVVPDRWHLTATVDASLVVLDSAPRPVQRRGAYVAHLGSGEHPVGVRVLQAPAVEPGTTGLVRLSLPTRLPLLPGDRFVLRDIGASATIGGGEILDVDPVLRPRAARPDRSVERVIREHGWVDPDELERLTGERRAPNVGRWVVDPDEIARASEVLRDSVRATQASGLDLAALDERARAIVPLDSSLVVTAGRVREVASDDPYATHPYLQALRATPFAPPTPEEAGVSAADLRELLRRRLVVREEGIVFSPEAIEQAAAVVGEVLSRSPDGATVSELRTALGTSRRFALALLAGMDRDGRTRRRGDRRVAGPRLTAPRA